MKIIKISSCSECPYSELVFKDDPNQKPLYIKNNIAYYGRMKTVNTYYCNECNGQFCGNRFLHGVH